MNWKVKSAVEQEDGLEPRPRGASALRAGSPVDWLTGRLLSIPKVTKLSHLAKQQHRSLRPSPAIIRSLPALAR
jgi:hypothetical protein